MATYQLLPGFGSKADLVLAMTADSVEKDSDVYDVTRCAQLALQVITWAAGNLSVKLQQSLDGVHFADISTTLVMVVGDMIRFPVEAGPYGLVRVAATSSDTAANATIRLVGWPIQVSN